MNQKSNRGSVSIIVMVFSMISLMLVLLLLDQFLVKEREILNFRDNLQTQQWVELALSEAEERIAGASAGTFDNKNGLYKSYDGELWYNKVSFDALSDVFTYGGGELPNASAPPTYIIEQLRPTFDVSDGLEVSTPVQSRHYRVTAQAKSDTGAKIKFQAIYEY
ncbi:MAG: hypothetical protein P8176_15480 [Gammaproteobacteria bacterium]